MDCTKTIEAKLTMATQTMMQCLNLGIALNLLKSGQQVGGVFYVYDPHGYRRTLESFVSDYPLERLQSMVQRMQSGH